VALNVSSTILNISIDQISAGKILPAAICLRKNLLTCCISTYLF